MGGWGGAGGLQDYSVSPSPSPIPLDFGFRIWDLVLGPGFGTWIWDWTFYTIGGGECEEVWYDADIYIHNRVEELD